ncbi:MAG: flagellar hook-length control protein FliK [Lachnospiraceae bacterium]
MKLTEIFTGVSKQTNPNREVQETERQSTAGHVNKQIKALTPGKVLYGEVVSKNGNEVQLKLSDDITLTARLDKDVNVEIGKILTFEVKNNGSSLFLSPLFANTATADNVFKALQMAGLPVNSSTVTMTETMMQQGMSINSKSLQNMFKEVMTNPAADAASVVQLRYMGMPVNEANLSQMESYKALTHQLVRGMTDVLEELPAAFHEVARSSGTDKAVQMYQELLQKLLPELDVKNTVVAPEGMESANPAEILENGSTTVTEGTVLQQSQGSESVLSGQGTASGGILPQQNQGSESILPGQETGARESDMQSNVSLRDDSIGAILSGQEREEVAGLLKAISRDSFSGIEKLVQDVESGTADMNQVLRALSDMAGGADRTEAMAELFKSPAYQKLFENTMLKAWSIKPDQAADAEKVKEMYSRLEKSLEGIRTVLENNGADHTPAMKSAANMSQNLDFMNQMNQMYTYVQLPLQMQEGRTNGELYVYTNKRSLAQNDGNVSAFLHLDMEHLGPVDVYVAMQNERVSTQFTLADDEMLDFLNAHMHTLTERLEKKGYSMHVEMKVKDVGEEDTTPIDRILQADKNATILKQYAFDVRA